MSDLARQERNAIAQPSDTEWDGMRRQAYLLAKSGIVPKALRGKPEDVMIVMLAARELGLPPMAALNKIDVIEGTPALRAKTQAGLVFRAGHEIWVDPASDETKAVAHGRRKGSDRVHDFTFTIEDARRAGLLDEWYELWTQTERGKNYKKTWSATKDGGDPPAWVKNDKAQKKRRENWHLYPKAMLRARAISGLCGFLFADVLVGFTTSAEELGAEIRPGDELPASRSAAADAQAEELIDEAEIVEDDDWPPQWLWKLQVHHPDEEILEAAREIVARNGGSVQINALEDLVDMPPHLRMELSKAVTGGDAKQEASEGGGDDVSVGKSRGTETQDPKTSAAGQQAMLPGCKKHPDEAQPYECEACAGIVNGWGAA